MSPPHILLLGKTGQLGNALQQALAPVGPVTAPSRTQCDLYDPGAVRRLVQELKPQVIVNAAAYTAVDAAQHHTGLAMQINAALPAILAEVAQQQQAWLVHYSSDYVYNGRQETPYPESEEPDPLNTYGRSKLAGDQAVAQCDRHLIIRSGWIFHRQGENFLRTILRRARQQTRLQVVNDQFGAPNSADFIAACTAHILPALLQERGEAGLYHVATSGRASWYDYACHLLQEAEELGLPLRCSASQVQAISSQMLGRLAPRPASCVLDTTKVQNAFNLYMPAWQLGVSQVIRDLVLAEIQASSISG